MATEIKPYSNADFHHLLRLMNELDIYGQVYSEEELKADLTLLKVEPEKNYFLVIEDGEPVGYARIWRNRDGTINRHHLRIALPPHLQESDDLFDRLITQLESRIAEIAGEYSDPLQIRASCYQEQKNHAKAFERHGYKLNRYFARMDLNDLSVLKPPETPAGVILRTLDVEKESAKPVDCLNRGFAGHFEFVPLTVEEYEEYMDTPQLQPQLMFVAESNGEFIGICLNKISPVPEADGFIWGVVDDLAVVPGWRGKGLGRALIRHSMLALREGGAQKICLWVDYDNPFGAKKLYYSEGFVDRYITVSYAKNEEPGPPFQGGRGGL
jgi:ribosomal protein S18 acetylase RimI-like enzyme